MKAQNFNGYKRTLLLVALFSLVLTKVDEGSIMVSLHSDFILQKKQDKINNMNYYTLELKVGTPEQTFNVEVDTSTSTTWIPSSKCENCEEINNLYSEENSRSSSPTNIFTTIEDEDGDVSGYEINDNVHLGTYKLKQYGFIEVTKFAEDFKDNKEGKLGLGYKSLRDNNEFNFLSKLKYHNLISKRVFSINEINEKTGLLFVGDIPGKQYTSFCNVTDTTDLDPIFQESWVCKLTHVGIFDVNQGIFNKMKYYDELKNNDLVSFDSAYDYIGVPISEKENIEKLLDTANLKCTSKIKEEILDRKQPLKNLIRKVEVTISCQTTPAELAKKALALSFVLQGHSYSLPLESLFVQTEKTGEMEMLVKYLDDEKAIWIFGYPFMNQFLMIFNLDEGNVGIKTLKKTSLPIVNVSKDWLKWYASNGNKSNLFMILSIVGITIVGLFVVFLIIRAIRKASLSSNGPAFDTAYDPKRVY